MAWNEDDEPPAIVLDNGSGFIKAGFAGEDEPRVCFSNVIGRQRSSNDTSTEYFIGSNAIAKKEMLSLHYPIEHGIVTNWDEMEKIWHHVFYTELHVAPEEHPVLLTEPPFNPKGNREKMAQILFEQFHVPAMYVAIDGILSTYAMGRTVSMVLEIGDGVIQTLPIYEGYSISLGITRVDFGGRDLTDRMVKLLSERVCALATTSGREIARDIKEKLSFDLSKMEIPFDHVLKQRKLWSLDWTKTFVKHFQFKFVVQLWNRCTWISIDR